MNNDVAASRADKAREQYGRLEDELPYWMIAWNRAVHILLSTTYFLLISFVAIGIDLGLHWFEHLHFVEHFGLSPIIRWEIEGMAYLLATVDCILFSRKMLVPIVDFTKRWFKR